MGQNIIVEFAKENNRRRDNYDDRGCVLAPICQLFPNSPAPPDLRLVLVGPLVSELLLRGCRGTRAGRYDSLTRYLGHLADTVHESFPHLPFPLVPYLAWGYRKHGRGMCDGERVLRVGRGSYFLFLVPGLRGVNEQPPNLDYLGLSPIGSQGLRPRGWLCLVCRCRP